MSRSNPRWSALVWLTPLAFLGAVVLVGRIVASPPADLVGVVISTLVVVSLAWILVAALWPARADRTCPACKKNALARLDGRTTHGVRCEACGWSDEAASSWLLAEDEAVPLEDIVLAGRNRSRTKESGVDSRRDAD